MLVYNSFNFKLLFILLLLFSLGLPLNSSINFILFLIGLLLTYTVKIKEKINFINSKIFFLIFLAIIPNFLSNKNIEEAHSSFFSISDINLISKFLPNKIIEEIKYDFIENFDINRAIKSSHIFNKKEELYNYNFIYRPYAFSSDNFFLRSDFSRFVENINFSKREDLRIGQFNSINYNLPYDKEFRRMIPYYILYKIPKSLSGSEICAKGKVYFSYSNVELANVKNNNFNKFKNDCIRINDNSKNLYILGYSINNDDNLDIKLNKNLSVLSLKYFKLILQISLFYFFINFIFNFKSISKLNFSVLVLSAITSIIFIYFKDFNLLTGLRYYRGGADGLFHEFQGIEIVKNLYKLNFYEAFRGGEDVYYFMPGLRYFIGINKIIFGDTSYGYVIIGFLLPIFLFELFRNLISEKISFFILISFLLLPVFENMGFGHFNYIHQIVRNHAETLSITIIIGCLAKISSSNFSIKLNYINVFFYCFFLAFATFCRPNYLPTTTIIFLYIFYLSLNKNYIFCLLGLFGYSFVLLGLYHNIYFGNELSLFTRSNVHFVFNDIFHSLNNNLENNIIINQFLKWNPLYFAHRLIILLLVFIFFLRSKNNLIISVLFLSTITQHIVLLLTHPDGRYAYLAWMLTLICFFYYLFNFYLKRFK